MGRENTYKWVFIFGALVIVGTATQYSITSHPLTFITGLVLMTPYVFTQFKKGYHGTDGDTIEAQ